MNEMQLLLQAKKEAIPALRNAREVMKKYFPNFGIKGGALEKSPVTDVLETTSIDTSAPKSIVSEFWDVLTQKSKGKVQSWLNGERNYGHRLQEIGDNGKIENELSVVKIFSDKDLGITGKQYSYDAAGRKIQTVESKFFTDGAFGNETITQFDNAGKVILEDYRSFPPRPRYLERSTVVNKSDGSSFETQIFASSDKNISPYKLEITRANNKKITRLSDSRTFYGTNERKSLVEVDPNTGNVTKLQLMGDMNGPWSHVRLEAEYNPENGACRSFRLFENGGKDLYNVKYDNNSNIIEAGGYSYKEFKKEGLPVIVPDAESGGKKLTGMTDLDDSILRQLK